MRSLEELTEQIARGRSVRFTSGNVVTDVATLEAAYDAEVEAEAAVSQRRLQQQEAVRQAGILQMAGRSDAPVFGDEELRAQLAAAQAELQALRGNTAATQEDTQSQSADADPRVTELLAFSKEELAGEAARLGLDATGTKAVLAARIAEAEKAQG